MFVKKKVPDIFSWKEVVSLLLKILDIAEKGLRERGLREEIFLRPLYRRSEELKSPAREMLEGLAKGKTMDDYIEEYGRL